jgi:hypothetical protein
MDSADAGLALPIPLPRVDENDVQASEPAADVAMALVRLFDPQVAVDHDDVVLAGVVELVENGGRTAHSGLRLACGCRSCPYLVSVTAERVGSAELASASEWWWSSARRCWQPFLCGLGCGSTWAPEPVLTSPWGSAATTMTTGSTRI